MTVSVAEALLYSEKAIEMDGYVINSWFDETTGEKNIELVWSHPLREVSFIANDMTPDELRRRLEMEAEAWRIVSEKR